MSIITISYYYNNMATIYEVLGKNIRNLRKAKGWSQAKLAEKVDVSVPYITMIELAQRSASLEVIQLIASAFSVTVSALFEEKNSEIAYPRLESAIEALGISIAAEEPYEAKVLGDKLEKRIRKLVEEILEDYKNQ